MSLPLVSIVTPSLNSATWITETIASVLAQDYARLEYIVMDGGSTDETHAILRGFGDRLTWYTEPDSGISQAVNRGWARSHGEILAWIGSDDLKARWHNVDVTLVRTATAHAPVASMITCVG